MSETFTPPASVASAAKRALDWIADGKAGSGFTSAGRARAGQLSRREGISRDTIMRMVSFFARHEVDKKAEGFSQGEKGYPSPGRVAWDAWGGDSGKSWAESISSKFNKEKINMAQDFTTSYAEIIKYDKNDDGTINVYGKATSDDLDIDQQICDNEWLNKAMPEWFKSGGNIREQHSSIASGVATEYETKGDGHYINALIVDPTSIKKVEAKVLKGFSIGIKSPRIVRDTKAANGRIVDGQIVEVSLVDRPANPTCQLVLAKSVGKDNLLTQVEELIEKADSVNKSLVIDTIIEMYEKSVSGSLVKFDQASYDTARKALAQLIIVEAGEMANSGSDERDSIDTLLSALKHLFNFYDGETQEGETPDSDTTMSDLINLSAVKEADPDTDDVGSAGCDCDGCASCKADGGCDSKVCKGCTKAKDKSATVSKCLECGCGQVGQAHGVSTVQIPGNNGGIRTTSNVSTAGSLDTSGSIKSAEGEETVEPIKDEAPLELIAEEATLEEHKDILDEKAISAIVEKAVKSATDSVKAEIANLATVTKAAEERALALETELVAAKSVAINGGPKRTGRIAVTDVNELMLKAAEYRAKAAATSDQILAKGYKALEKEYLAKAGKSEAE